MCDLETGILGVTICGSDYLTQLHISMLPRALHDRNILAPCNGVTVKGLNAWSSAGGETSR